MKTRVVRLRSRAIAWFSIAVGLAAPGAYAMAQTSSRVVSVNDERVKETNHASDILSRRVSVRLDRVPVKEAVDAIAASANVRVYYRRELLDAVTAPVTVRGDTIALSDAFARVFAGTTLQAVALPDDIVTIQPRAATSASIAQGAIVGAVTNTKTKAPIRGATVLLDDAAKGVVTGDDGTFRLQASPGEHHVTVRAVGFVRRTIRVTVTADKSVTADFALDPSASVLNEVVVTGSIVETERKAIATPITVITAEEIEKRGITRIDQFFRGEVPGVLALDMGAYGFRAGTANVSANDLGAQQQTYVYTRGASTLSSSKTNPLKTYIDGVEVLDPSYLGTIDPRSIERIEIVAGPQAATIYGSGAVGGVMQIFTKKGRGERAPEATLALRYGTLENNFTSALTPSHDHSLSVIGGSGPEFSYSGTLSYRYTGQWQPALFTRSYGTSFGVTHTRGPFTASGTVSLTSARSGTTTSNAGGSAIYKANVASGLWLGVNPATFITQRTASSTMQTLALNVDYRTGTILQHHLTVGRSQSNFGLRADRPQFDVVADTLLPSGVSSGSRMTGGYNMTLAPAPFGRISTTLSLGVSGSSGEQTQTVACLTSNASTTYVPCGNTAISVRRSIDSEGWGGFASWRLGFFDQLYFTAGVRGERNPAYGREHSVDWTPTVGTTYSIEYGDLTVKFLASYGRATRPPTLDMRQRVVETSASYEPSQWVSQLEAPELRPEFSTGPQGGVEVYYGNLGSFTINRFRQTVVDLIQNIRVDSIPLWSLARNREEYTWGMQYQNTGKVRQQGWETTGALNFGPFGLKGTYSWTDSRIVALSKRVSVGIDESQFYVGMASDRLPTHTGNVTATYALGRTSVTAVMNYIGKSVRSNSLSALNYQRSSARLAMYTPIRNSLPSVLPNMGYVKSDLAVAHQITPWMSGTLNVNNLANRFTADLSAIYPSLGRQTLFGLSLRFPQR